MLPCCGHKSIVCLYSYFELLRSCPIKKKKKQLKVVQNSLYTKLAQIYLFKYVWTDIKLRKTIMKIRALTEAKKTRNHFDISELGLVIAESKFLS